MHEITSFSALAFSWIMDNPLIVDEYMDQLRYSKKYLKKSFNRFNIKFKDTCVNFVFIFFNDKKVEEFLYELKDKEKILLKKPFGKDPLKGWIRLTVGTMDQSKKIISVLEKYCGE